MKYTLKSLLIIASIFLVVGLIESKRVRHRHHKTKGGNLAAMFQGFLSGAAQVSGIQINKCLPTSLQGKYLELDKDAQEPDGGKKTTSVLGYILKGLKFTLDMACAFKSAIMKIFGLGRRRRNRYRRIFLSRRNRGILDWFSTAWNWAKSKVMNLGTWLSHCWDNLVKWTKEKWNALKKWTSQMWSALWAKLKDAWKSFTAFFGKIKDWIVTKVIPLVNMVMACGNIFKQMFNTIKDIVSAISQLAGGNVAKIADMIINLICSYQTILDVSIFIFTLISYGEKLQLHGKTLELQEHSTSERLWEH
jgi:hypothetical protein